MTKAWVITLEPSDKSAPKRKVEIVNGRKKIAEVEKHLGVLYRELMINDKSDLSENITRSSGVVTTLDKSPYVFSAELTEL